MTIDLYFNHFGRNHHIIKEPVLKDNSRQPKYEQTNQGMKDVMGLLEKEKIWVKIRISK